MDRNKIAYLAWMRGNECIHSPLFTAFFLISNYQWNDSSTIWERYPLLWISCLWYFRLIYYLWISRRSVREAVELHWGWNAIKLVWFLWFFGFSFLLSIIIILLIIIIAIIIIIIIKMEVVFLLVIVIYKY